MSLAINSAIKLDLPIAPRAQTAGLFNESLVAYGAIRAIHSATSSAFGQDVVSGESPDVDGAVSLYAINNLAKIVMRAFSDIQAGKFLECFKSGGTYYVRHTRYVSGSDMSLGSIGLSLEDRSAGEYVEVYVSPSIIPGFSGLTVGRAYRFFEDGQFTDAFVGSRTCGVALSDRHMRIVSFGLNQYA